MPYHLPGTLLCDFITASDSKEKKNKWPDTEIALTKRVLSLYSQEMKKKKKKGENPQNVGVRSQMYYMLLGIRSWQRILQDGCQSELEGEGNQVIRKFSLENDCI